MKYFFLAFGKMSLRALNDLISMNLKPEFVMTHNSYLYEENKETFYDRIQEICVNNSVKCIRTDKISSYADEISKTNLGVSVGFMEIIKPEIFNLPEFGILNLHCGELPFYKGRAPISRTIMDGNQSLFITLHKIDSGVDSGPILTEKEIIIEDDDDVNSLYYKCSIHSAVLIRDGIELLISGKDNLFKVQENNEKFSPQQKISEKERLIDWNTDIRKIYNKIRALSNPYPSAYTFCDSKKYYFNRAKSVNSNAVSKDYGTITDVNNDFILINCKGGFLMVYDIKDESFAEVDFKSNFKIGDRFI